MASMAGAVDAWEGALTDNSEVLEGMVAAVREADDAALALQVKCIPRSGPRYVDTMPTRSFSRGFSTTLWARHARLAPAGGRATQIS